MFGGSDSEKAQVVGWVQIPHSASCFGSQLLHLASILHGGGVVQGSADRDA